MYDQAYINYLIYFHCERDYFECHEVLEEHWKSDPPNQRKPYWVGLIQVAVGLYHHRRGNFPGALKMISNALTLLENDRNALLTLGIHSEELLAILNKRKKEIADKQAYYSINLPINDKELLQVCQRHCETSRLNWGQESDLSNEFLIHKHKKRNRSTVIAERNQQLELRKNAKNS